MSVTNVTDKEIALLEEVERLKGLISEHNRGCRISCAAQRVTGRCRDYVKRGRNCPDCPLDWLIDDESPLK